MKKYTAKSVIAVNIILPGGENRRIAFTPNSMGRSIYYTNDPDIQYGLEHHYKFGDLYRLAEETKEEEESLLRADRNQESEKEKAKDTGCEMQEMTFSDFLSAKDYLCANYSFPRTKIKTMKNLNEAAASVGIKIIVEE